jgi:hypothetical protein
VDEIDIRLKTRSTRALKFVGVKLCALCHDYNSIIRKMQAGVVHVIILA